MLPLLWSILNVLVLGLFLYASYRVARYLQQHIGFVLAFTFVLGLLIIRGNAREEVTKPKNLLANENRSSPSANMSFLHSVPITSTHSLSLLVEAKREGAKVTPTGLYLSVAGFILGHKWEPIMGLVFQQKARLRYQIILIHEWRLMGVNLYTSSEEYAGIMPISK